MGGIGSALVGGLFSLGGAALQAGAASDAAETQANAAREAQAAQAAAIEKGIVTLKDAEQKAYTDLLAGYTQSQATAAPYNLAGLGALDLYLQSVGIAPPAGGSTAFSFALQQALQAEGKIKTFKPVTVDTEKAFNTLKKTISSDYSIWEDQFPSYAPGLQKAEQLAGKPAGTFDTTSTWGNDPQKGIQGLEAAWAALDTEDKKLEFLTSMSEGLKESPQTGRFFNLGVWSPEAISELHKFTGIIDEAGEPVEPPPALTTDQQSLLEQYRGGQLLQPTQPGDKRGLTAFLGSPEYQALYGTTGPAADPNATPLQRFQASPGYEFQLQEGVNAIQRASGPKGLLESGAILKDLTAYGSGLANQEYSNYQTRLQNVFGRYQANLAGLTSLGAGFTAAQSAQDYAYGTDVSQVGLGTAANIASLHQSLGKSNAEALMAAGNASAQGQLASGAAWASGLSGFGSSLANAFQQQSLSPAQAWQNPLPAGQAAFGNSSILGAFAPSGFF